MAKNADLEFRLKSLENGNRWLCGLVAILMGGLLISSASAPAQAQATEYRGTKFVLVDGQGKERAQLCMDGDQPLLRMTAPNGSPQVVLGIVAGHENSAELSLATPDGSTVARLGAVGPSQKAFVQLMQTNKRVMLQTGGSGEQPSVHFVDERGRTTLLLPAPKPARGKKSDARLGF